VNNAVVVRRAEVDDALAIAEVHVASWNGAYRGLMPQQLLDAHTVQRREPLWRDQLASACVTTWVAELSGRVIGFASVGPSRDSDITGAVGELRAIYLTPEAWGTGAGYALHESALATLATNYDEAVLWVLDSNARAREFYERHHWSADGATKQETRGDAVLNEVRYRRFTAATGRGQL